MATKLLVARFVNSALIPYFVRTNSDLWFIKGGLAPNVFTLVASLAFLDPILVFINYGWFLKVIFRCLAKSKGEDSTLTQEEANKLYEEPELSVADFYAGTTNLLLTAMFYFPVNPIGLPIALIGNCLSYLAHRRYIL